MYPKGSPKYNICQLSKMGKKKSSPKHTKRPSPKIRKRSSPKGEKPRAQWNAMLERSLVEILHEHDNPYHRGQNGWSCESWNTIVDLFHARNPHVKFDKSQVHDKEKELKRDYKFLKDARMQSGVGWNEREFKLEAEPHLWENLGISFGTKFLKFKKKRFPLYDTLGDLYHRHIAEGHFNFTSTAEQPLNPNVTNIESDDDGKEMDDEGGLQILEQSEVEQVQGTQRRAGVEQVQGTQRRAEVEQVQGTQRMAEVEQVQGAQRRAEVEQVQGAQRRAEVEQEQGTQRKVAGPSQIKPSKPKRSPKKSSADGLVGVMERFVKIKEKEANHEATQNFTITKCIAELRNLEGFDPAQKPRAFAVFKSEENREIFLNAVGDKDGSALAWLQMEMDK